MPPTNNKVISRSSTKPVYVTYFGKHYEAVRFTLEQDENPGLRRGQIGALRAIADHFTLGRTQKC